MKRLPIGLSDYKHLIEEGFYYVDKTLFINDLITRGGHVNLFPRPRRFGKTLNISMLRYFFEKTNESNAHLFENKKIWQIPQARALQGKFPVIFLTFKDVKEESWEMTYKKIVDLIANEFKRHDYLLSDKKIRQIDLYTFKNICEKSAQPSDVYTSLRFLSDLLEQHHQSRVIILIDEYDAPIHEAFIKGYYEKVTGFMRSFLGGGLKDNTSLHLGAITGILRTAKEDIFSGLNNLEVFTILSKDCADNFGFTEQEIDQMLHDFKLTHVKDDFKEWYNGYLIGDVKIYNPWSSINCIKNHGQLAPYWVNTIENGLIKKIIASSQVDIKEACSDLIAGKLIPSIQIDDKMILPGMINDSRSIWNLFLFTGYLTVSSLFINEMGRTICSLTLPNRELHSLFDDIISELFNNRINLTDMRHLSTALETGDGQLFETLLGKFILSSMSFHDTTEDEPENSYHLFVLGLLVVFANRYAVRSNRESGYGRFDIMLIPHDRTKRGIIIEFKKKDKRETIEQCADRALEQITTKEYATELKSLGIQNITFFGIACHKKEVLLKQTYGI